MSSCRLVESNLGGCAGLDYEGATGVGEDTGTGELLEECSDGGFQGALLAGGGMAEGLEGFRVDVGGCHIGNYVWVL